MKHKDKKMLFGIGIVFLFLATVGFSYAYFTSTLVNKDVKNQIVETGTLQLTYTDGAEIVMQNMKPGDTITKTVYVANTGTFDAVYNLVWQELTNEIENDEMLIEGTCTRINGTTEVEDGTCEGITGTIISSSIIKGKTIVEPNIIHKYDLTITFKETSADQNYNQGKKFSGVLGVNEVKLTQFEKDSWKTIATNVRNGNISIYNLGDTKEVDLGDLGIHKVRISNTSTPDECSTEGFSQTACGFVLEFENIISLYAMNTTTMVAFNDGGWPASDIRNYVNTDIYNKLPNDLKDIILDTIVISGYGSHDSSVFTSTDKLYLLAPKEIYSDFSSTFDTINDLTRTLDHYVSEDVANSGYSGRIKKYENSAKGWWLRSARSDRNDRFLCVSYIGTVHDDYSPNHYGVSPAFRVG